MVGHWDFAYGPEQLLNLASQLNYPVLGINVYKDNGELMLPPCLIKEIGSIKIGVIGICSNIIDKTMPKEFSDGIKITNGEEELPSYIKEVKEHGADLVILLSHNGFPQDCELLSKTEGIDICLSAHTHNRLYEALTINDTIIIQCGCHGSFAGKLEVEVRNKRIDHYAYTLVPMDEQILPDEQIEKQIHEMLLPYKTLKQKIAGKAVQNIHRYNALNSGMDNLLLAAIAHIMDCSVAFSNGWRYGAPIPPGPISLSDLYNIIPMNPLVSTVELTGEEIKHLLEDNIERTFSCYPMQQMGGYLKRCFGMTAYIKIENRKGARIQELFIGGIHYARNKSYKAAFVTEQGVPHHVGKNREHTAIRAVDAMADFLKKNLLDSLILNNLAFIIV